jgi:stress response protein SCP2
MSSDKNNPFGNPPPDNNQNSGSSNSPFGNPAGTPGPFGATPGQNPSPFGNSAPNPNNPFLQQDKQAPSPFTSTDPKKPKVVIQKGKSIPLLYTQKGRQRVTVGLLWDTPEAIPTNDTETFVPQTDLGVSHYGEQLDIEIGYVQEVYDLDLVCLMFDKDKNLVDAVSPDPLESIDVSGAVYHSGDEMEGISGGDDEQISVELGHLPENVYSIVFLGIIQSGHYYGHVLNAECRVADGRTNTELWRMPLGRTIKEGADKTASAFCMLHNDENMGWMLTNLSEYRVDKEVEDWAAEVNQFLPD